jgi:hypothetical protein
MNYQPFRVIVLVAFRREGGRHPDRNHLDWAAWPWLEVSLQALCQELPRHLILRIDEVFFGTSRRRVLSESQTNLIGSLKYHGSRLVLAIRLTRIPRVDHPTPALVGETCSAPSQ